MQQPYIIDNQSLILKNDLLEKIKEGSRVSIVAACFSIYAYQQMKRQLSSLKDFRFIYTSPTFTKDTAAKKQREFYIPRMDRAQDDRQEGEDSPHLHHLLSHGLDGRESAAPHLRRPFDGSRL